MKKFIILFLLLLSLNGTANALGYYYGFVGVSGTTGLDGTVTVNVKVPGTFNSILPSDPTAGRFLHDALLWTDSPSTSDEITVLQVVIPMV